MKIEVRLFAGAREAVGHDSVTLELRDEATVAELQAALASRFERLQALLSHAMFAVDSEYVGKDTVLRPGVEVACIPPVSGG